jgi:ABC-type branched-subunit amino acid transport system ATPase component
MQTEILTVNQVYKSFGGNHAVENCSFHVKSGTITGLIGPNGAGKTTMFNLISGLLKTNSGEIIFQNKNIEKLSANKIANLKIARSYQAIRLFPELSALENLIIADENNKESLLAALKGQKKAQQKLKAKAHKLLKEVNLEEKAELKAKNLSYGQKKLLEIQRTKVNTPTLILLDEPTAGINPTLIKKVEKIIKNLKKEGKTILIVEHNMPFIMNLCDEIVVMDQGRVIAQDTPKNIQNNPQVLKAYLGK